MPPKIIARLSSGLLILGVLMLAIAPPAASAHATKTHCGQEHVERKETSSELNEARYGDISIAVSSRSMTAIYAQSPHNWASRHAATCELAELVANEAVDKQLEGINTYSPGFVGEGASWYVGHYTCSNEPAPGTPGPERGEIETCIHKGSHANTVSFWDLETGEYV
jgi:hypothetical protein